MKINCTDFSGPATEATDHALELARLYGASTHLFHRGSDRIHAGPGGDMPLSPAELDEFSIHRLLTSRRLTRPLPPWEVDPP